MILELIAQRVYSLIEAAQEDTAERAKWIAYLFETFRWNSTPQETAEIPTVFTDHYARAALHDNMLSLTELTCCRDFDGEHSFVFFSKGMLAYVYSSFGKHSPPRLTLTSDAVMGAGSWYYLEGPKADFSDIDFAVGEIVPVDSGDSLKLRFLLSERASKAIRRKLWLELHEYDFIPHFSDTLSAILLPRSEAPELLEILGMMGALPSKDEQMRLWVEERMLPLLGGDRSVYDAYSHYFTLAPVPIPVPETLEVPEVPHLEALIALLDSALSSASLDDGKQEQRPFYWLLLRRLLVALLDKAGDEHTDEYTEHVKRAAQARLALALKAITASTPMEYTTFLTYVRLCTDDLMLLMSCGAFASAGRPVASMIEELKTILTHFVERHCDRKPSYVALANSGMNAFHQSLITAVEEISARRGCTRLAIDNHAYFEITAPGYLKLCNSTSETNGRELCRPYHGAIFDLWCGGFEANICLGKNGYIHTDISEVISTQLSLRKAATDPSPLVLLLDNTMSRFDEVYLNLLLAEYDEEINNGQLAILVTHSLNKFFNMGLDNTPAGLVYCFYSQPHFPHIHTMHHAYPFGIASGLNPAGQTARYIMTLMRHASDLIDLFYARIRTRSHYIHQHCIPKSLFADHPLIVSKPFSRTVTSSDEVALEKPPLLSNCWHFIVITAQIYKYGLTMAKVIDNALCAFFEDAAVYGRSGFGFAQTTYDRFKKIEDKKHILEVYRISLGTEDLEQQIAFVKALVIFLSRMNGLIERHLWTMREDKGAYLACQIKKLSHTIRAERRSPYGFFDRGLSATRTQAGEVLATDVMPTTP